MSYCNTEQYIAPSPQVERVGVRLKKYQSKQAYLAQQA